jgi:hypothetical protein
MIDGMELKDDVTVVVDQALTPLLKVLVDGTSEVGSQSLDESRGQLLIWESARLSARFFCCDYCLFAYGF